MSTRATYLFKAGESGADVCFYVHYDGYPDGAADYFRAAVKVPNERGGWAGRFVRGVDYAEFTSGHEAHGDTEFRYTVLPEGSLVAEQRRLDGSWERFGTWSHLAEFVNHYSRPDQPKLVKLTPRWGHPFWLEEADALEYVQMTSLKALLALRTQGLTGNTEGALGYAAVLAESAGKTDLGASLRDLLDTGRQYREVLMTLPVEELEAALLDKGLEVPPAPLFGSKQAEYAYALVRHWALTTVPVKTYRVKSKRGFVTHYDIPEGVDALTWLNWDYRARGSALYKAEDIVIEGQEPAEDKRITA